MKHKLKSEIKSDFTENIGASDAACVNFEMNKEL